MYLKLGAEGANNPEMQGGETKKKKKKDTHTHTLLILSKALGEGSA